jgi:hypothetical protein
MYPAMSVGMLVYILYRRDLSGRLDSPATKVAD